MQYIGVLNKMQTEHQNPIQYHLALEEATLLINDLIGKNCSITFQRYSCLHCHKPRKIFRTGFCYSCYYKSAQAGDWIFRPELSTAHLDIADRDLDYEKSVQLQPHVVYLALSNQVKVGVTRKTQTPTRWIDQGAAQAIEIIEVPNRYLAGITEVALKEHFADKTNWRKMLQNDIASVDLVAEKSKLSAWLPEEVQGYMASSSNQLWTFDYPVAQYPTKVTSLNLEKTRSYSGTLSGIRGQYWLFADGTVFNVRNHEGFVVEISLL